MNLAIYIYIYIIIIIKKKKLSRATRGSMTSYFKCWTFWWKSIWFCWEHLHGDVYFLYSWKKKMTKFYISYHNPSLGFESWDNPRRHKLLNILSITLRGVWFTVICLWCDVYYDDVTLIFLVYFIFSNISII